MVRRICRVALLTLAVLYALAVLALLAGAFGWLGAEADPLSGIFLVPLGLPWNRLIDALPEPAWPWLAAAAPLINLVALWLICRAASRVAGGR